MYWGDFKLSIVKKGIIAVVVLGSVITFTTFGMSNAHQVSGEPVGNMVDLTAPMYEDMSTTVLVPGSLELVDRQVINELAENGGYELLVEVGDVVEEGTPLIQYSTTEIDYEIQDVQLQIDRSNASISKYTTSENEVTKRKNGPDVKPTFITDEETGEKTEVDPVVTVAELDAELAELAEMKKEENYTLTRLTNQLEGIKEQKEQLTVKSKIKGTILKINEQGEAQSEAVYGGTSTTALMEVADTSKFTITGNISERQSLDVEVGHSVFVYSDTLTESTWNGEVIDVSYFPTESNDWYGDASGSQYPVTILVTEGDTEMLRPGYQVFAEILTSEQLALAVPMEALKYDEFSTYVLVYEDGIAVKREVEIGFSNDYSVEVISGLTEEDQVILDYMETIDEGMEVVPFDYGDFEEDSYYEEDESMVEDEFDDSEFEEEIENVEEESTDEGEDV